MRSPHVDQTLHLHRSPLHHCLPGSQSSGYHANRVDPGLLEYVDDRGRNQIAEARRLRDENRDAVAAAKRRAEQARGELQVEDSTRKVGEAELQKAQTEERVQRQAAGVEGNGTVRAEEASVRTANDTVAIADDRIAWRKACIDAADRDVALAEGRLALADAKVALVEARALCTTNWPEADKVDLMAIERDVRARQTEVDVARVRQEAAVKEVDLAKRCVDETPKQRRDRIRNRLRIDETERR